MADACALHLRLASLAAISAQGPVAVQGALAPARFLLWGLAALAVVMGLLFALWLARVITRPLAEAVLIAETVAARDLSQDFETEREG